MKKTYLYDLTVLITQQVSDTPTGTVRVDLRYAQYFLKEHRDNTLFVKQQGKRLEIISSKEVEALVEHLVEKWETGTSQGENKISPMLSSLEFRIKHHGLWDPDLESFFSMPFRERFYFLINHELTEIFGMGREFAWVQSLPHFLKICYALIGSLARIPATFLLRSGQFIGVYLQTRNLRTAYRFISTRKGKAEYVLDQARLYPESHYYYVYTAYNRGFPFDALDAIREAASLELCIFIHDLIVINFAEYYIPVNHQEQITQIKRLLRLQPHLIVNSIETEKSIRRFAEENNRSVGAITLTNIGVEPCFLNGTAILPETDRGPETNIFVVISTIEPRKNHLLLLNIWRELAQKKLLDPLPHLYLVGRRGWENENIVDMMERCRSIQGFVHEVSMLNDAELIDLLRRSRAMLYPSFCEGWGMPIVESLSLGVPVICSDIPELRESGQGIPEYIHPIDGKRWMEVIIDYCQPDSALRQAQMQRHKGFQPPNWEDHFRQITDQVLNGQTNPENCAKGTSES